MTKGHVYTCGPEDTVDSGENNGAAPARPVLHAHQRSLGTRAHAASAVSPTPPLPPPPPPPHHHRPLLFTTYPQTPRDRGSRRTRNSHTQTHSIIHHSSLITHHANRKPAALQKLVEHRVTGLPVIDAAQRCVGVVADSDLLALSSLGKVKDDRQLFPMADVTWHVSAAVRFSWGEGGCVVVGGIYVGGADVLSTPGCECRWGRDGLIAPGCCF
jgi:hypothetical protein